MPISVGKRKRLITAIETSQAAVVTVFAPQIQDNVDQFKYDKLTQALIELRQAADLDDEILVKELGLEAFYRYVLFQGRVINDESETLIVTDSFQEIFDLMTVIISL